MKSRDFIHPSGKEYFIVEFDLSKDRDQIVDFGPWFWDNYGLCMKPWSPYFDSFTNILTLDHVWVRIPNIPLHFWGLPSFGDTGKYIGRFYFKSLERKNLIICTYA